MPSRHAGSGVPLLVAWCLVMACVLALAPLAAVAQAPEAMYRIGPKDVLKITVYGHEDLTRTVVVSDHGVVALPLIGDVQAAGLTPTELEAQLKERLGKDYLVDPQLAVAIQEYRSQRVFVLGEAERPGTYALTGRASLLDILSQAGGPGKNAGRQVVVVRAPTSEGPVTPGAAGAQTFEVNLKRLLAGERSENLTLQNGDTVYLPKVTSFFVLGEVQHQGAFVMDKDTALLEAITLAGGFTDKAAPAGAKVLRKRADGTQETIEVDLSGSGSPQAREMLVGEGDTVFVPRGNAFFVSGEVRKPGAYQLDRPTTAFGAITLAGGFTEKAAPGQVKLSRRLPGGEEQTTILDLSGAEPQARDTPLKDGDTLLVPLGNTFFVLGEVRRPGAYQLDRTLTAFGAIALAGGFTDKAGQTRVKVIRRGTTGQEEEVVVDLSGADARGRELPLRDGDTVLVPLGNTYFVSGEVRKPGAYQLDRPTTAFSAITLAGGFTEKAGQTQVKVIHRAGGGEEQPETLDLSGTDSRAREHLLRDGDMLVVPSGNTVFVLGEVRNPGAYQLDKSMTAFGAVALAGGFTDKAGQTQVKVVRRGVGGEEQQTLDLSGSDPGARDHVLKDGDTLVVPSGNTVFVLGEVRNPGAYQLDKSLTAFGAVALAGGFTDKAGSGQVRLVRRGVVGQEQHLLDLSGAGGQGREFPLKDGDSVIVPLGSTFFVLGEVRRPGVYQLDKPLTAFSAVAMAGGLTEKAAESQAKVIRHLPGGDEQTIVLDLSGTDPRARDFALKDGDALVIPTGNTFFVLGEVRRPGAYQLDRNSTAITGITLAGGFTEKAGQTQVKLVRRGTAGQEEQAVLDLSGSDARARDYALKDGDTLVVPSGNTFFVLGEVKRPGAYQLDKSMAAFGAIALAGGFTDKAGQAQVKLVRRGTAGEDEQVVLDLSGGDPRAREYPLKDGDTLVVPTGNTFFVSGEVRRPGAYQIDRLTTAFGAVTLAGGFTEKAAQTQVTLVRRLPSGKEEAEVLDLSGADPRARDHALRDGDTLIVPTGNSVFVLGEVRRPGAYQLDKSSTALGAVALAGGFTEKAAQTQVKVIRRGAGTEEEQILVDLSGNDARARDHALRDGDTLVVPTGNTFFVLGEVRRSGAYQLDRNSTAIGAITLAGGFTEKAAQSQVKLVRRSTTGQEEQVVLDLSGGDARARDFPMRDGDTLVVPIGNTFFVLGEVRRPGAYQLDKTITAFGAIALAGGFTEKGGQTQTKLIRRGAGDEEEHIVLDLSGVDRAAREYPLKEGDTLVVPTGNTFFVSGEVRRPGAYQLERNTTAATGVTLAGGFTEKAGQSLVKLVRRSTTGQEEQVLLDLSGGDARARDFPLRDGDTLVVPSGNTFFVLGEVKKPGAYQLERSTTAIAGVTLAGGFTEKAGQSQVRLVRRSTTGQEEQVLLDLSGGDPRARDLPLRDGDSLVVPSGNTFYVLGEVRKPGAYQLERSTTAIAGVTLGGGFTDKAGQTHVKLVRRLPGGQEEQLILDLSGADPRARDLPLRDGDTLVVPVGNTFYVMGEVKKPGAYQLDQTTTAIQAIALAGGFTDKAAPNRTRIIRVHPDGRQETLTVDLNEVMKRGRREKDVPLMANDVVVVPESFF